jgi:hypothetical protein
MPASSAAATVIGFIVEPGSMRSVAARLRCASRLAPSTAFGLKDGRFAIASTSPVARRAPPPNRWLAPFSSSARLRSSR